MRDDVIPVDRDPGPPDEPLQTSVHDLIEFLGRPHMHSVIFYSAAGCDRAVRYSEIKESAAVPRNTLVNRLKELVDVDLLERMEYEENPPRVEYQATEKLLALVPVFKAMHAWCKDWSLDGSQDDDHANADGFSHFGDS